MAAAADVRDMLDLPAEGQSRPSKKQKVVEKRPEGITRELYALLGERAPPIAINENKYKGRPKFMNKLRVRKWCMTPFTNNARSDGLVLNHWQREHESTRPPAPDATQMDVDTTADGEKPEGTSTQEKEYRFAKYNVKARVPRRYTDEEYNRHLKSDDWTREETDYLMDLVAEYDVRWVIIADRYDYQRHLDSEPEANAIVPAKQYRTMEQMKARYYYVAATMLAIEHPPSEMSEAEFALHEQMLKYDPDRERDRKDLAALQLNRTADEVREEAMLLEELKRITSNEQNFITERRELYSRLEVPISVGNTTMYQTSQGLHQLLQTLLQADKSKKRRSILGPEAVAPSPAGQTPTQTTAPGRAETPSTTAAPKETTKKGSAAPQPQPSLRTLTPAEETRYGVQHHERLTGGVQFRSDRAQKLTQAKSNVQTQKLASALAELEIPVRLFMPTERVCKDFEKLIQSVNLLLDARKVAEKVESEIRVLEAAKAERERKEAPESTDKDPEHREVKKEADEAGNSMLSSTAADAPAAASSTALPTDGESAQEKTREASADASAAVPEEQPAKEDGNHKRSASVLSNASDKSFKRQRR
ncbi:SWR1-complex protein 4 [Penicillium diatomitis]|uniref:SWR1-complex protein 4 n=1 Tax=Penicillium diatomitis TaxID=2819901 RepID=A0A9W9X6G8_9EURO|nr:SWR1-complex protein 4 [Penicillium diatomitis]KAJ5485029.1 SWR1-complex protein 4 [Penicillium diatomitis]